MTISFMNLCVCAFDYSLPLHGTGLEFTTVPVSTIVNAGPGEQAMFTYMQVDSMIMATARWQRNGVNLNNDQSYSGVASNTLTISNANDQLEGAYTVVLTKLPGEGGIAEPCIVTVPNPGATPPDNLPAILVVGE